MEKKEIIKNLLFGILLLYSGFGFISSVNDLNSYTITEQNQTIFIQEREFNFNDLQEYNELIIKRFEFSLLFVAVLILMISDSKNIFMRSNK